MNKKIVHISSGHGGEFEVVKKIVSYRKKKYDVKDQIITFQESKDFPSLGVKKIFDEDIVSLKSMRKLKRLSKASDIVFYHNIGNFSALIWMFFLNIFCRKRIVAIFHSNLDGPGILLKRLFFRLRKYLIVHIVFFISKRVVYVSSAQRATYKKMFLFKNKFSKKSLVIHNFIENSFISNKILEKKNTLRLIFVGRLSFFKGFSDLLKVIKKLIKLNYKFKLNILGKGKLRNQIPKKKSIKLFESIENRDIDKYYDQNDILIFPSYTESFGMVIIEAMARGLVVLASDLPAIREIIKDKENGFLFSPGDTGKMEELIKYCAENPLEMESIKRRNLTEVKRFTEEKQAVKYQKLIDELLYDNNTVRAKTRFFLNTEGFFGFLKLLFRYLISKIKYRIPKNKEKELIFNKYSNPKVSIIIPVYNQWEYTYNCLKSVLENTNDEKYEIIVADDCSTDRTEKIKDIVKNILVISNESNKGFLRNCNNAAKSAKGEYLLFLNNDTEVTEGWLQSMIKVIESQPNVGIIGAKLLYKKGMLQEAGGIVWKNGTSWKFGRLGSSDLPQYDYIKCVDYVSAACLLTPKKLWEELGGFSEYLGKAYFEDTDYCFKVREKGLSVIYQPRAEVLHYENVSYGNGHDLEPVRRVFYERWKAVLDKEHSYPMQEVFFAKDRSQRKKLKIYYCQDRNIAKCICNIEKIIAEDNSNFKFLSSKKLKKDEVEQLGQLGVESIFPKRRAKKWFKTYKEQIKNVFIYKQKLYECKNDFTWNRLKKAGSIIEKKEV